MRVWDAMVLSVGRGGPQVTAQQWLGDSQASMPWQGIQRPDKRKAGAAAVLGTTVRAARRERRAMMACLYGQYRHGLLFDRLKLQDKRQLDLPGASQALSASSLVC